MMGIQKGGFTNLKHEISHALRTSTADVKSTKLRYPILCRL